MKVCACFAPYLVSLLCLGFFDTTSAFLNPLRNSKNSSIQKMAATLEPGTNICDLPGDPSLVLTTNVDLGDKKMEVMKGERFYLQYAHELGKSLSRIFRPLIPPLLYAYIFTACSKAIQAATGKPESYIGETPLENTSRETIS